MTAQPPPTGAGTFLHIRCGHDILQGLEEAGVPGTKVAWADPLCDGPVPADLDRAAVRALRAPWLAGALGLDAAEVAADLAAADAALDTAGDAAEIVLWFEHDLYDQAILIYLLTVLAPLVRSGRPVTLVCIDRHPEVPRFYGLGQLSPPALRRLFEARAPVTADQVALAEAAWAAYTAPEPDALVALLTRLTETETVTETVTAGAPPATPGPPLPFLGAALVRHAQEFPWQAEGLSLSQWLALDCIDVYGEISAGQTFRAMQGREAAPWQGDLQVFAVLRGLASWQPEPLLTQIGTDWPRGVGFRCTDAGRAVLLGKRDALDGHPLDRWRGGVHLHPDRPDWRWDAGAETLVRLR